MKRIIILALVIISASTVFGQEKGKVAIYTTDNSGENIGEFVGNFLINGITKRGTYTAIDQTAQFLTALNKEQSFQHKEIVDNSQISQIGKNMGVQLVCVVQTGKKGKKLFISACLIDVETATQKAATRRIRFNIGDSSEIEKSCEAIASSLFDKRDSGDSSISGEQSPETQRHPTEIEMVFVQGNTFGMGCSSEQGEDCYNDESPLHSVTLNDFYIGKYEITQAQWEALMGTNIRQQRDKADTNRPLAGEGDNYPMYYVSWEEVQEFILRLNVATGKHYRLPTEAEWEYAARGGKSSKGYKYSGSNNLYEIAWYEENAGGQNHPIGTKKANELGIYDMSGNVWEWCNDWYTIYLDSTQNDSIGAVASNYLDSTQNDSTGVVAFNRVFRGGGFGNKDRYCRVTARSGNLPSYRGGILGFRLAYSLEEKHD
ncbi:MAG: formylglycine-generating enzyme family protein [Bacteroidales bacterium]|jgi:formylglycine-generating enzyme required for sulfatase activity|nr:formylglycine-generating enzyme family protein [Bacteroidales bacterium]